MEELLCDAVDGHDNDVDRTIFFDVVNAYVPPMTERAAVHAATVSGDVFILMKGC